MRDDLGFDAIDLLIIALHCHVPHFDALLGEVQSIYVLHLVKGRGDVSDGAGVGQHTDDNRPQLLVLLAELVDVNEALLEGLALDGDAQRDVLLAAFLGEVADALTERLELRLPDGEQVTAVGIDALKLLVGQAR